MIRSQPPGSTLSLYHTFGIVYGSLSVSPIYVYRSTFSEKLCHYQSEDVIFGAFSVIFWTLTLLSLLKYTIIILNANDNGQGGTFALYSLLCRHGKLGLFPNFQTADEELSTYHMDGPCIRSTPASSVKRYFVKQKKTRTSLLLLVLFGACMMIAIGILIPPLSVLSCIEGLQVKAHNLHHGIEVLCACAIIIGIFVLQHLGTNKVAFLFHPVVTLWLLFSAAIGIYNIFHWNPRVFRGLSPFYVYNFFRCTGRDGWISLGGMLLCITGNDAMFSELGHFSASSIRVTFSFVIYPILVLQYMGQSAFISSNILSTPKSFYESIPDVLFWPAFLLSTCVAIVGSLAVISSTFSIISQCHAFGCFPRVKVVDTSRWIQGQIYIPEMNWVLMILTLLLMVGFHETSRIANAYGIACMTATFVTTWLMFLTMFFVWHKSFTYAVIFFLFFGSVEALYISSAYVRIPRGGWFPLALSAVYMTTMYVWHYGTRQKYLHDLHNKVTLKSVLALGPSLGVLRPPGVGIIYNELVSGVPSILTHFLTNLSAFNTVAVFVTVKFVPLSHVPDKERYLVGRVGPIPYSLYRCVIRYGYKDVHKERDDFENDLIMSIAEFVRMEGENSEAERSGLRRLRSGPGESSSGSARLVGEEVLKLEAAKRAGVTYVIGHSRIKAKKSAGFVKKFVVDVLFSFLRKNCRAPAVALQIPQTSLIEVGLNYYI